MSDFPAALPEFRERRAAAGSMVVEAPMPKLIRPDASANAVIPAHCGTKAPVGMGEKPDERPGPKLRDCLNQFHPHQHAPIRDVFALQDLVLVIPTAQIGLNNAAGGFLLGKRSPTMWSGIKRLDLIRVAGNDLPERAPIVPVGFL